MPITNTNREILDLKRAEFCTPAPVATTAGSFVIPSKHVKNQPMFVSSNTAQYLYLAAQDSFVQVPSATLAGTFGAGACGVASGISYGNTAASTTIAAGSNNVTLQSNPSTINVAAITGFPLNGAFFVDTATNGRQLVTYTAATGTTLTGCTGGTGTMLTGQIVSFAGHTALAGTTTSITTSQLLARDLRGYSVQILSGPNAGSTIQISSNSTFTGSTTVAAGSNGLALPQATLNVASTAGFPASGQVLVAINGGWQIVTYTGITATSFTGCTGGTGTLATSQVVQFASSITVPAQASAFTTATVFRLITPRYYVLGAGTLAAGSFRAYDFATNAWTSLSITGLPATVGTDGVMVATPSWLDSAYVNFASGTATSATATTLAQTGKSWANNQWVNSEVRITGGTGAGQVRTITANDATSLTVSGWNTTPDATSSYVIQGNDDFLYFLGNNAVTMYRYSITSNSWTTLSPTVARAGATGAGMFATWIQNVSDSAWTNESSIINGRRIYSFRGGATTALDYYDIPTNTWINAVSYAPATETFTTGSDFVYNGDFIYLQKDSTGRWFRYDLIRSAMDGWTTLLYPQSTAIVGNTAFDVVFRDGSSEIVYIHMLLNSLSINLRMMVIG